MASPVVVDGRLDREKLLELLAIGAEHAELEFKTTLDLRDSKHRLGLVKDIIALGNTGAGGYVVVGANDDGTPALDQEPVEPLQFDSADLAQAVVRHVSAPPIVTSQSHEIDGWTYVVIHASPNSTRLPCIINTSGEYQDGKRMKTVLQEGTLYVREGTHTVTATDGHWELLLSRYRAEVIARAREDIDLLVRKVVEGMGERADKQRLAPLALEMDDLTFAEAVEPYLGTSEGERKLRRYVRGLVTDVGATNPDDGARNNALNKLSIIAIQAMFADSHESFDSAVGTLHTAYQASVDGNESRDSPVPRALYWLEVALRLVCIGAAAIREQAWWAVVPLTDRPGSSHYPVWLRHALVEASRAGLLSGDSREDALLLVRARALAQVNPMLGPDIGTVREMAPADTFVTNDPLLDSLCQFDFLWCVVARLRHPDEHDSTLFYPSCAALNQSRAQPLIVSMARSREMREAVSPDNSDIEWATAMGAVLKLAEKQSLVYGGSWWGDDDTGEVVSSFVRSS